MAQVQQKMEQGQASAAIELALRLIQIDGSRWEGYALSAESASKLNDYKLAVDMYQRAIAHAPADSRSRLEERLKQVQEAAQK
jgi:Tfp pilus assembly protein PilF